MITLGSLFDGIGGAPLCAVLSGAEPVWASEIEKFPIKVTEHHFPNMKHYGDITKINGKEIDPVDIIVGGSPCQDLSIAGKRAGLEGERSGLFMEQIRIVREMRSLGTNHPRYMVWENVPGAFSSNGGEDFRIVLEETARIADPGISIPRPSAGWSDAGSVLGDGWTISWRVLDAQHFGVPQRRRRIYLVADFGGQTAPEILFESHGMQGDLEANGKARENIAAAHDVRAIEAVALYMREGCDGGGKGPLIQTERTGAITTSAMPTIFNASKCINDRPVPPLMACGAGSNRIAGMPLEYESIIYEPDYSVRRLTPLECERLQGYPDGWTDIPGASDSNRYKALGNSFAIPCALFVIQGIVERMRA